MFRRHIFRGLILEGFIQVYLLTLTKLSIQFFIRQVRPLTFSIHSQIHLIFANSKVFTHYAGFINSTGFACSTNFRNFKYSASFISCYFYLFVHVLFLVASHGYLLTVYVFTLGLAVNSYGYSFISQFTDEIIHFAAD